MSRPPLSLLHPAQYRGILFGMPGPLVLPPSTLRIIDAGDKAEVYIPLTERATAEPFARSHKGDIAWERNKGDIAWERNKGDISKLIKYWTRGEGGALIGWGQPCDYCSCLAHLAKYVRADEVHGFCARLHKRATGKWPGPRSKGKHCPC